METYSPFKEGYNEWYNSMINNPDMVCLGNTVADYIKGIGIIHAPMFASRKEIDEQIKFLDEQVEKFKRLLFKHGKTILNIH